MATHEEKKKEETLKRIRESLTPQEAERLDFQRQFDQVDPKSENGKLGVRVDPLRVLQRTMQEEVQKKLWNITNMTNQRKRLADQLATKKITEQLKDGVTMNEEEVLTEIEHIGWLLQSEVNSLPVTLWQLRGIVGQHDVLKQLILSQEDFDKFVRGVEKRLNEYGLSLY